MCACYMLLVGNSCENKVEEMDLLTGCPFLFMPNGWEGEGVISYISFRGKFSQSNMMKPVGKWRVQFLQSSVSFSFPDMNLKPPL